MLTQANHSVCMLVDPPPVAMRQCGRPVTITRRHCNPSEVTSAADDKRCRAGHAMTAFATPTLVTPEFVVDLDQATHWLAVVAFARGLHQLLLDQPSGFARHPRITGQCHCRQSGPALREPENRQTPISNGHLLFLNSVRAVNELGWWQRWH